MSYQTNRFENSRICVAGDYNRIYYTFFGRKNTEAMSREITFRLQGIHPDGKNIIVSDKQLLSVMDSIYKTTVRDLDRMVMMTISYIVEAITDDFVTREQNSKLSAWVQKFPESSGLRQYSKIKIREKRPTSFQFIENY